MSEGAYDHELATLTRDLMDRASQELEEVERALMTVKTLSQIPGYQTLCKQLVDSHWDEELIFEPLDIDYFLSSVMELVDSQNPAAGVYA